MKFRMGENVVLTERPAVVGNVTGRVEKRGVMSEYRVNFGGGNEDWHFEDRLETVERQLAAPPIEDPLHAKKLRCMSHEDRLAVYRAAGANWDAFKLAVSHLVTDEEAQRIG